MDMPVLLCAESSTVPAQARLDSPSYHAAVLLSRVFPVCSGQMLDKLLLPLSLQEQS